VAVVALGHDNGLTLRCQARPNVRQRLYGTGRGYLPRLRVGTRALREADCIPGGRQAFLGLCVEDHPRRSHGATVFRQRDAVHNRGVRGQVLDLDPALVELDGRAVPEVLAGIRALRLESETGRADGGAGGVVSTVQDG
jgi:hypothetical protein